MGIGTTTPDCPLQINQDNPYGTPNQLQIFGKTTTNSGLLLGYNTSSNYASLQSWALGSPIRKLVLQLSAGNVGIRATTPTVALDVNSSFKASAMPTIICPITTVIAPNNFPFGTPETLTGNISSDGSSIPIGETGLYLITFTLGFTGYSHGWITVNGVGRLVSWTNQNASINTTTTIAPLSSGNVIQLYLNSGTLTGPDLNRTFICVTKLH